MSVDQEVIDMGWDKYMESMKDSYVDVGYTGPSANTKIESGINLATLAHIHEFGRLISTTAKQRAHMAFRGLILGNTIKIPKRPFMRVSMTEQRAELLKFIGQMELAILLGFVKRKDALERIGDKHKAEIQKNMRKKGKFAANHPFTVMEKGSDNELIDTGRLVNAIDIGVHGV